MAGYTSRFFLTLTIPSVFGFLSVLWFLKRKTPSKSVSKAVQVENSAESEFENQFLTLDPMKLKNNEESREDNVSSEMQLKETQTSPPPNANGVQQNGKAKSKKKSKSKLREKPCTFPKDYILGDSSLEDNGIDLSNGIEAIDLNATNGSAKDELLQNTINKTRSEMETTNGTNSCSPQTSACVNGDSEKHTVSETDTNRSTQQQNGGSAKEQCDTTDEEVTSTEERNSVSDESKSEKSDSPPSLQTDSHEPLTLPGDCTETTGEMLESPGATYCDSLGSNDSGKGPSEIHFDTYQVRPWSDQNRLVLYEFDIFQEYVGLLIGKHGRHVHYIKEETNANILIKRHPYYDRKKICSVTGTDDEIHAALKLIRRRFPIETYPTVTLSQVCSLPYDIQDPGSLKLSLPEGVSFDVMLSATVTAGHFFLQQPTHPTFHSLPFLSTQMTALYNQDMAPALHIVGKGYVCSANLQGNWYRAEIDEVFEESDECRVKFLDYGGYTILPRTSLKQIRCDFMCVPFQATECYLGDVTFPDGATEWSREATAAFEELAQGQILQGFIVAYAENRVPFVKLFKLTGANMVDINGELVRRGLAKSLQAVQQ